jgi:spore germination cell wall hydrolase CwlJ-like protein
MFRKIFSLLICFLIIAGGSTEAAAGPETKVGADSMSSPAAVMLSGSALDPLLKPTIDLKEETKAKRENSLPAAVIQVTAASKRFSAKDLDLLARLVHAESGSEPFAGKVAVAASVLNRVESSRYPNTIPGVIYQRDHGYQYCPVRIGTINKPAGQAARKAVEEALRGHDPTGGALSFYNPALATNVWIRNRPVHMRIGNHVFVR